MKIPAMITLAILTAALASPGCNQQPDVQSDVRASGIGANLALSPDGFAVVSYIENNGASSTLRFHKIDAGTWGEARTVASGPNWFVNWADFPSVQPVTASFWAAHWLVRRDAGGYAYDVFGAVSGDAGVTWSDPFLLHNDGTDTEHGFVTLFPTGSGFAAIWLDGRNMSAHDDSAGGMTLRSARFDAFGSVINEQLVDELTCDCCQTDVAMTNEGPVAVYRNRTHDEVRDIYVSRFATGEWQSGLAVFNDGWEIAGCPVNGPVVRANESTVVVTWFTAAADTPTVKSAWSTDAGRSFSEPITAATEGVIGYVGSALLSKTSSVASWICKVPGDRHSICYRLVRNDGRLGEIQRLETSGIVARMSVPQLAMVENDLLFVWTDIKDKKFVISSRTIPLSTLGE